MDFEKLKDGNQIPKIGLGTWRLTDNCTQIIKDALRIGYRHIDTATLYDNHTKIGEGIKGFDRQKLFITSKLARKDHDPTRVSACCDSALQELGTDFLDLYLVHWPKHNEKFVDVVGEFVKLKEKGKIRSIGLSNATVHHIQDLFNAGIEIVMNQFEIHPFFNQYPLVKFCQTHAIGVTAYSQFAKELLLKNKLLQQIASQKNCTIYQVVLRWLYQRGIIAIPKASSVKHLEENFAVNIELSTNDMAAINNLNEDRRLISPEYNEFDY